MTIMLNIRLQTMRHAVCALWVMLKSQLNDEDIEAAKRARIKRTTLRKRGRYCEKFIVISMKTTAIRQQTNIIPLTIYMLKQYIFNYLDWWRLTQWQKHKWCKAERQAMYGCMHSCMYVKQFWVQRWTWNCLTHSSVCFAFL